MHRGNKKKKLRKKDESYILQKVDVFLILYVSTNNWLLLKSLYNNEQFVLMWFQTMVLRFLCPMASQKAP